MEKSYCVPTVSKASFSNVSTAAKAQQPPQFPWSLTFGSNLRVAVKGAYSKSSSFGGCVDCRVCSGTFSPVCVLSNSACVSSDSGVGPYIEQPSAHLHT